MPALTAQIAYHKGRKTTPAIAPEPPASSSAANAKIAANKRIPARTNLGSRIAYARIAIRDTLSPSTWNEK